MFHSSHFRRVNKTKTIDKQNTKINFFQFRTTIIHIPFSQAINITANDFGIARRFFHHICTIIANRYLKVLFQKTGSYTKDYTFSTFSPSNEICNAETISMLEKLNLSESDTIAEYQCKVKGKVCYFFFFLH